MLNPPLVHVCRYARDFIIAPAYTILKSFIDIHLATSQHYPAFVDCFSFHPPTHIPTTIILRCANFWYNIDRCYEWVTAWKPLNENQPPAAHSPYLVSTCFLSSWWSRWACRSHSWGATVNASADQCKWCCPSGDLEVTPDDVSRTSDGHVDLDIDWWMNSVCVNEEYVGMWIIMIFLYQYVQVTDSTIHVGVNHMKFFATKISYLLFILREIKFNALCFQAGR